MKYSVDIEIEKPISEVVELFRNQNNNKHWMEGLQTLELLSGEAAKTGAKSKYVFTMGKRTVEMTETVLEGNLPAKYLVSYEATGVYNTVCTKFESINAESTKCINESEFKFKGFMMFMAILMPGAFKKQSRKYLEDFKAFAEAA